MIVPSKCRSNVNYIDRFRLKFACRLTKLKSAVLVRVDKLICKRRCEEEEYTGREAEGLSRTVRKERGAMHLSGKRSNDGGFSHRRSEMSTASTGKPANE